MGTIVEKSEYLTETKDKIKESINNIGGDITSETTFREYAQELQDIYDNLPKTTGEGTNLSLNTLKGKMGIIPKGDIEQETREGYNLFQAKLQTTTANGITVTNNNNGTFTINGTNTSTSLTTFRLDQSTQNGVDNLQNYEDGTYTLDLGIQNENIQITLMQVNTWQQFIATGMNVRLKSGTITGATGMFIYIAIKGNATLNNVVIKPMFVKGSYTTSTIPSFEQYGQMPSPSYPSDIEVVTGTQEVKVENKNLLSEDDITIQALNIIGERPKYIEVGNKVYRTIITELKAGTYTLSLSQNFWFTRQCINDVVSNVSQLTNNYTFTLVENSIFEISFRKENSTEFENTDFTAQIEKGSTATPYKPYQEQIQTISLGNIELCKIGNYQDYLYKSNDKWYKKEYIGKVVLNGSETGWSTDGTQGGGLRYKYYESTCINTTPVTDVGQLFCNYFSPRSANQTYTNIVGVSYDNVGSSNLIFKDSTSDTLEAFKTWLSTHNTEVRYVLATPNDIEITNSSLIEQLNNIEKLKSYNGTTNISSTGNLPMVLSVSAIKGE